jgi:hypothetical protein
MIDALPQIRPLLADLQLLDLGPGVPNAGVKPLLDELARELPQIAKERAFASACLAGLWLGHGFMDESHAISQDLDTLEGSFGTASCTAASRIAGMRNTGSGACPCIRSSPNCTSKRSRWPGRNFARPSESGRRGTQAHSSICANWQRSRNRSGACAARSSAANGICCSAIATNERSRSESTAACKVRCSIPPRDGLPWQSIS